jgi:hypothetical protein
MFPGVPGSSWKSGRQATPASHVTFANRTTEYVRYTPVPTACKGVKYLVLGASHDYYFPS